MVYSPESYTIYMALFRTVEGSCRCSHLPIPPKNLTDRFLGIKKSFDRKTLRLLSYGLSNFIFLVREYRINRKFRKTKIIVFGCTNVFFGQFVERMRAFHQADKRSALKNLSSLIFVVMPLLNLIASKIYYFC